jgi:hypothetical protein
MKLGYSPYAPTPITAQEFSEFITGSIKIGNLGTPVGFDAITWNLTPAF